MERTAALDLFKFYAGELKDVQAMYFTLVLIMSACLLGTTIWFLTSDKPHRMFARIKYARNIFLVSLIVTALVEGRIILLLSGIARRIQSALSTVAPQIDANLKPGFYTYRNLSLETSLWFYGFHVMLFAVLFYLVWNSKRTAALSTQEVSIKKRIKRNLAA